MAGCRPVPESADDSITGLLAQLGQGNREVESRLVAPCRAADQSLLPPAGCTTIRKPSSWRYSDAIGKLFEPVFYLPRHPRRGRIRTSSRLSTRSHAHFPPRVLNQERALAHQRSPVLEDTWAFHVSYQLARRKP